MPGDQAVAAAGHGDGPLGVRSQGQARHPEQGGFLLHATGVGDHCLRAFDQGDELQVAERGSGMQPRVLAEPGGLQGGAAPRMHRDDHVHLVRHLVQGQNQGARGRRIVHVGWPVQGRDHVPVRQPQLGPDCRRVELRHAGQQRVDHRIADQVHRIHRPAFAGQVPDRLGRRHEQQRAQLVGEPPVDLLRHGVVEAAQAGLHVSQRNAELRAGQGRAQGGVDVTVDHGQRR